MTEDHQPQIEAPFEDAEIGADAVEQSDEAELREPQAEDRIKAVVIAPDDAATPEPENYPADEQSEAAEPNEAESEEPDASAADDQIDAEPAEPEPDFEPTVESVIEAVLFASDESLTPERLAGIIETGVKQVRKHIESLNEKYRAANNAFRIEQIAGGYQMLTLSPYNHWLKKLLRARSDSKLSPAALETLAIVAYKQPVIRADIEVIRGVAVGEVLRGLMYKGLVKIVGRAEILGRPMLYGTTKKFLEVFGLNSLKDLPKVEELKKPPA